MRGWNLRIGNLYVGGKLGDGPTAILLLQVQPPAGGHFDNRDKAEALVGPVCRLFGVTRAKVRVVRSKTTRDEA